MSRFAAAAAGVLVLAGFTLAAPLTLVDKGTTAYVIYRDNASPGSVKAGALEIQRVIKASTGVELIVVDAPAPKMISLGDNPASRATGLSPEGLPEDAYRIVTRGDCLYILGFDSPRNKVGWGGAENRGTLYGAYAFLERAVNVRWLHPGDEGEDIPSQQTITLPETDVTSAPFFVSRILGHGPGAVSGHRDWNTRLGLGGWRVNYGHNWAAFPSRAVLRAHPEYLAERNGRRLTVPADDQAPFEPKFCTTNPGLVKAYADGAIDWLRQNPNQRFVAISPSDGGGWCECPECSKYVLKGPDPLWGDFGCWGHSVAPLILKFYNDVARIVGTACPDRKVCGFVYYDFAWPPARMPKMEPNFVLMFAPLQHYGLTRYKPEYRAEFEKLCAAWSQAAPVGYYGASTWMRVAIGAPLGPSLLLLKHTFATLKKNNFRFVSYYNLPWDSCAVHNYIAARLMWDPSADVDALFTEWCDRAYGPGGPAMARLYRFLDAQVEAYKKPSDTLRSDYEMTSDMAVQVYAKNFTTIEALYSEALAKTATDRQRARLLPFGDNLVILHHVLNQAGVLPDAAKSAFSRTDEQYQAFLKGPSPAVYSMSVAARHGAITGVVAPRKRAVALVPRAMNVRRLPQGVPPPRLDGDLGDAAWRAASELGDAQSVADKFTLLGGDGAVRNATRVLALYDDECLYLAFRCADAEVTAPERKRDDDGLYADDSVEFMFCCGPGDPAWNWHITLNAANAQWDALTVGRARFNKAEDFKWDSATAQGEGFWAAEVRIPFKSIRVPGPAPAGPLTGIAWRINFARSDVPTKEFSTWSPVEQGFITNPKEMGSWRFLP